jgi:hypothetical protein
MKALYKRRLLKLADTITNLPEKDEKGRPVRFNMDRWFGGPDEWSGCGTVACMAGWAVVQSQKGRTLAQKINTTQAGIRRAKAAEYAATGIHAKAAEYLGLNDEQAHRLFIPEAFRSGNFTKISAMRAAGVIRLFVKTGEIEWNRHRYPREVA